MPSTTDMGASSNQRFTGLKPSGLTAEPRLLLEINNNINDTIRTSNIILTSPSVQCSMKKRPEETQTLRAGCSKAEPKIFALPQTHSRGRGIAKI